MTEPRTLFEFTDSRRKKVELSGNYTHAAVWRIIEKEAMPFTIISTQLSGLRIDFHADWLKPFPVGRSVTVLTDEAIDDPLQLAHRVLEAKNGIDRISALKPVGSPASGPWVGIVRRGIERMDDEERAVYLRALESEKSGAISSDDFYLHYSKKWLKALGYATGKKPNDLLALAKGNPQGDAEMALIYLMFGDIAGLSDGFRPKESELSDLAKLWYDRQKQITERILKGNARMAPRFFHPIAEYLQQNGCSQMARILSFPPISRVSAFLTFIIAPLDETLNKIKDHYNAPLSQLFFSNPMIKDVLLNHVSIYPRNKDTFPIITSINAREYGNNGADLEKLGLAGGQKFKDVVVFIVRGVIFHPVRSFEFSPTIASNS